MYPVGLKECNLVLKLLTSPVQIIGQTHFSTSSGLTLVLVKEVPDRSFLSIRNYFLSVNPNLITIIDNNYDL